MAEYKKSDREISLRSNASDATREWVEITVNNQSVRVREGEKLTAALLAAGIRTLHHKEYSNAPRGMFCNMGVCHDCMVTVNGRPFVRACLTRVEAGMKVEVDREWA